MTTFELKIIFSGICVFVKNKNKNKAQAKVLLVDGRPESDSLMHVCPVVRFNRRDLDPANTRLPDLCRDGVTGLLMGDSLCFLDREDVTISGDPAFITAFEFAPATKSPDQQEPTESDRSDMAWVADLDSISPGAGQPQKWWFDSPPVVKKGDRSPFVARVQLDNGVLGTWDFMRSYKSAGPGQTTPPDVYELNSSYKQALASFVSCSIRCKENTQITLATTSWESDLPTTKKLIFAPLRRDLRIEIWNTPFFDIMQSFFPDAPPQWSFPFGSGQTFKHHYNAHQPAKTGPYPNPNNHSFAKSALQQVALTKGAGCGPGQAVDYDY